MIALTGQSQSARLKYQIEAQIHSSIQSSGDTESLHMPITWTTKCICIRLVQPWSTYITHKDNQLSHTSIANDVINSNPGQYGVYAAVGAYDILINVQITDFSTAQVTNHRTAFKKTWYAICIQSSLPCLRMVRFPAAHILPAVGPCWARSAAQRGPAPGSQGWSTWQGTASGSGAAECHTH